MSGPVGTSGRVYWITGLAGAGKTTIATALRALLVRNGRPAVLLDGDELRSVLGGVHGHDPSDRLYLAGSYARLCKLLSAQGVDVVCATVSMFGAVRAWNREHIADYVEVYLTAPEAELHRRRPLYRHAGPDDVVGRNRVYELPTDPHLTIDNDGSREPGRIAEHILRSQRPHEKEIAG